MKKYFIPNRYDISTEINGKVYNGYYTEEKGMITVNYEDFSKSTQQSLSKNDSKTISQKSQKRLKKCSHHLEKR